MTGAPLPADIAFEPDAAGALTPPDAAAPPRADGMSIGVGLGVLAGDVLDGAMLLGDMAEAGGCIVGSSELPQPARTHSTPPAHAALAHTARARAVMKFASRRARCRRARVRMMYEPTFTLLDEAHSCTAAK